MSEHGTRLETPELCRNRICVQRSSAAPQKQTAMEWGTQQGYTGVWQGTDAAHDASSSGIFLALLPVYSPQEFPPGVTNPAGCACRV